MELGTLVPHLLYLKYVGLLFKFQFGKIAAPQVEKQILVHLPHFPLSIFIIFQACNTYFTLPLN